MSEQATFILGAIALFGLSNALAFICGWLSRNSLERRSPRMIYRVGRIRSADRERVRKRLGIR